MKNSDFGKLRVLAPALLAGGLAALAFGGCGNAHSNNATATAPGAPVTAAAAVERNITLTQEFSGRMESIERVDIRARVAGYITSVHFTPGSRVRKGQLLFVIDPRPFAAEASRAQAAALAASAKAELAKLELKRAEKLLADRAIAQREYDERASALKELDANAHAAAAQYETARLNLGYTQVTAPIDGRVSKAEITVGNLVDQTAVLTSVVSDERIYASFDGDEETYLQVGARARRNEQVKVRIGLASEAGFPHEGRLEFVDNQLDAGSGAVRMRAVFANTDNLLAPGLFARVQVDSGATDGHKAVLINDQAISTDQSRKFVYVVGKDNKAEYRQVTLGATSGGLRIVRSGLKAGETIVVNGLQRVHPGALLAPQVVAMDAADVKLASAGKGSRP
ncbi:multidrug efflux system membrane fusion protein [Duganella sp. 1224]|uniref:efflux RND transporter periplasmic adaptor subunit n=1 Tax=Duganella sp. 1224 TaxID=2587052 RepID=UPI0015CA6901|nr:efflux RND transporter periplasmic adaptor subunit [Duganella sp. 1224]NYE59430.1 multidrug efflux system membrane fusion protein [Duganella sp. 1224]